MKLLENASKIAEGINSTVYHLKKGTYDRDVILKVIKEDFNFYPHSSQLFNEDDHIRDLKIEGVRSSVDLIDEHHTPILVLEYFDGMNLKEWIKSTQPSFIDCLRVAIQICESISGVHSKNIIHRDISAYNILINSKGETSLIDFGLATTVNIKLNVKGVSDQLEGTLPYISPEQTGRVNHVVDQRSDIYSLGVVFYELFTGKLPFQSVDPMELVHAHLAIPPKPLSDITPSIPDIFSKIILKMLAKDVEHRYQSVTGLLQDLKKCLGQIDLKVQIDSFQLGENDASGKFLIPSKLYGRDEEKKQLLDSICGMGEGKREITLVQGNSGTGKTSLIYEIHKPITQKKGYFLKGKNEQYQKDRPYQAITQAISGLVSLLLSENEKRLSEWRQLIQQAVGDQGKLLTDLIPNLELILGKQKKLPVLGINEAQNRFNYIFTSFMRALAVKEHPIVLFIDDLQWSDSATLELLKNLITDPDLEYFYFIGAFRDNEIDNSHPVRLIFSELESQGIKTNEIQLTELSAENTCSLVADTFTCDVSVARDLASIVYAKTAGNPFFVNQFLQSIYEKELVKYHHPSGQENKGQWAWDINELEAMNFTDNVVDFMVEKLEKIDEGTQTILKLASCIGDHFDLNTIKFLQDFSGSDIMDDLWKAVIEQLLLVEEGNSDLVHNRKLVSADMSLSLEYKFAHDRIRQAAYQLIPEQEKSKIHQRIGERLLEKIDLQNQSERVFDIVYQLNLGQPESKNKTFRLHLSELNYTAGLRAKNSSANAAALKYFEAGKVLLEDRDWQENHSLTFNIHLGAMECHYLLGNYSEMEKLGNTLTSHATNKLETLKAQNILIFSLIARNKHHDLIKFGCSILKSVGIKLPQKPTDANILIGLVKTKFLLSGKSAETFGKLPPMSNEAMNLAVNMMSSISTGSYHNYPKLFPLIIFKSVQLSLKYGNSIDSIPFYGGYGTILCGVTGDYEAGYEFGQLSLKLLDSPLDTKAILPKTHVIFGAFINHWKDHLKEAIPYLEEAYLVALETGDTQYAASAIFLHSYSHFHTGTDLVTLMPKLKAYQEKMGTLNQKAYHLYMSVFHQSVINLHEENDEPWELDGEVFSEKAFLDENELNEDRTALFHIAFHKLYSNYLFGRHQRALVNADLAKGYLDVVLSTAYVPLFYFYDSLNCLALHEISVGKKGGLLKRVKSNQKKMKKWASCSPKNYLHKYELIEAEIISIYKGGTAAKNWYERSLQHAQETDYQNELALCYERFSEHFERSSDPANKALYLQKAYKTYMSWGALSKAKQLREDYPSLVEGGKMSTIGTFTSTQTYGSISGNTFLDLSTVLKAASTISSEIQLNRAIPTLLNLVMENAGAQMGAFFLEEDKSLKLYAQASVEEDAHMVAPMEVSQIENLPSSVLNYVGRTHESVVIDSATEDERFVNDPYIEKHKIQSILCLPIVLGGNLLGLIYLENRLSKGTFNVQRVDLLSLLSGQIAITLNNALLYDLLEQKVEERTEKIELQKEQLNLQNVKLKDTNEEKDYLISVVSHDLRNPLYLIKGYANMVREEIQNTETDKLLKPILESCDRMDNLIKNILDTSAINAQEIKLDYEDVDLVKLLSDETTDFEKLAKEKEIELLFTASVQAFPIKTDLSYFRQIISNLISNALKYTDKQGRVSITLEPNTNSYRIVVRDNGQGISKHDQKLLFSQFKPLSSTPTAGEKATGLGLSIVRKYAEAMGGRIWCESEIGKGSSFFVEFPIN